MRALSGSQDTVALLASTHAQAKFMRQRFSIKVESIPSWLLPDPLYLQQQIKVGNTVVRFVASGNSLRGCTLSHMYVVHDLDKRKAEEYSEAMVIHCLRNSATIEPFIAE